MHCNKNIASHKINEFGWAGPIADVGCHSFLALALNKRGKRQYFAGRPEPEINYLKGLLSSGRGVAGHLGRLLAQLLSLLGQRRNLGFDVFGVQRRQLLGILGAQYALGEFE